jgi:Mn-dependent DtxR family transcriptional regulator
MPARKRRKRPADSVEDLLKKLLITQLSLARVQQRDIAKLLGISLGSVNAIAKFIKLPKS